MVEPNVGGERVMRCRGDNAVFQGVAGFEAEDAYGFDADVLVGGGASDGWVGRVGDRAGENVYRAAARVGDADERNFDLFEGAVEVEIEACELADTEFVVDFDQGVYFFAAVAAGFEADAGFEEFDFGGEFGWGIGHRLFPWFLLQFLGGFFGRLLRRSLCTLWGCGTRAEKKDCGRNRRRG